jgi:hypothetical protein
MTHLLSSWTFLFSITRFRYNSVYLFYVAKFCCYHLEGLEKQLDKSSFCLVSCTLLSHYIVSGYLWEYPLKKLRILKKLRSQPFAE